MNNPESYPDQYRGPIFDRFAAWLLGLACGLVLALFFFTLVTKEMSCN